MDDLVVEEILLRFPPDEPASLVRAALVCKRWRRLISGPGFRRRFHEFHRARRVLGLLYSFWADPDDADRADVAHFLPMVAFGSPHCFETRRWRAIDARHGHVLFRRHGEALGGAGDLLVCDAITGEQQVLPIPTRQWSEWTAAVVCPAAGACGHIDCPHGVFLVVFVGSDPLDTRIYTYSSDAAAWSEPISTQYPHLIDGSIRSAFAGNSLYFGFLVMDEILGYDVPSRQFSLIQLPTTRPNHYVLRSTASGGLGLAAEQYFKLYTWSRKDSPQSDAGWTQSGVIELRTLFPIDRLTSVDVVGFIDGSDVIYVRANNNVLFTFDLRTCKVEKVCKRRRINTPVPYISYFIPAWGAACAVEGVKVAQVHENLAHAGASQAREIWVPPQQN